MVLGRELRGGVAARALFVVLLLFASRAHAQHQTPVFVRVNAGAAFTVSVPQGRHMAALHVAECSEACGFWVYPGKYQVLVQGQQGDVTTTLRIRGPGNYDFRPEDSAPHTAGLVLGTTGPVVTSVGGVLMLIGVYNGCAADGPAIHPCSTPPIVYYGLATFFAGAGMTTAGWIVYAHNRAHFELNEPGSAPPTSARLGLIPMPRGGLGFGATVTF